MSEQTPLYGLENWINYLENNPIPVRSSVQRKLLKLLNDNTTNLKVITEFVKSDPAISFHVVRQANAFHIKKGSQANSIEHAVNSLGIDNLTSLLRKLPVIKVSPQALSHRMFFRACANSLIASELTRQWLKQKHSIFTEEGQLASLFYNASQWLMWLYAPVHMANIYTQVHQQGQDNEVAETKILGCKLKDIAQRMNQSWQLPALTNEAIEQKGQLGEISFHKLFRWAKADKELSEEDSRQFGLAMQDKSFAVVLANKLTQTHKSGSELKHAEALNLLAAAYLKLEPDAQQQDFTATTLRVSSRYHVPGMLSAAAELLFINSSDEFDYTITQSELIRLLPNYPAPGFETTAISQPAARGSRGDGSRGRNALKGTGIDVEENTPQAFKNKKLFDKVITLLSNDERKLSPKQILQYIVKGLNEGIGTEAVIVYKVEKDMCKHVLSYGLNDDHPAKNYRTSIQKNGLFTKLSKKPACVWVNADNHASMIRILPNNYRPFMSNSGNLFVSFDLGDGKYAIIHAYRVKTSINRNDHQACVQLCSYAKKAAA